MKLPEYFLFQKPFQEHHLYNEGGVYIHEEILSEIPEPILFKANKDSVCVSIGDNRKLNTSYFIGVDWITKDLAIYVEPKVNELDAQTNYLFMLFSALKHPEVANHTDDLFEIKWDSPEIEITQQQDLLTPLLVVQFLKVVKEIVRKGLKKSYYKVENNLYANVKGKVLVSQTIKKNLLKNKPLNTYCSYDEFGLNGLENRLLKKALVFVKRYLPTMKNLHAEEYSTEVFNYINPSFEFVSEEVELNDVKHTKTNSFYKEYDEGLRLAKLILKRFGYNISTTRQNTIKTPPFWIDMSKLFELYVLGILKNEFHDEIHFQFGSTQNETYYGQPDFILKKKGKETIIDAKYKKQYQPETVNFNEYLIKDIRQLSGYARDNKIIEFLGINPAPIIDCLIIYPKNEFLKPNEKPNISLDDKTEIKQFNHFYKIGVKLPVISTR